jgi:hypothetical protein
VRSHALIFFTGRKHPQDKADQEHSADEYDQIGCKKGQDEPNGVVEMVGGDKNKDSKEKKKTPQE